MAGISWKGPVVSRAASLKSQIVFLLTDCWGDKAVAGSREYDVDKFVLAVCSSCEALSWPGGSDAIIDTAARGG